MSGSSPERPVEPFNLVRRGGGVVFVTDSAEIVDDFGSKRRMFDRPHREGGSRFGLLFNMQEHRRVIRQVRMLTLTDNVPTRAFEFVSGNIKPIQGM